MNTENGSDIQQKEQTFLFVKESLVIKTTDAITETNNLQNGIKDGTLSKDNVDTVRISIFSYLLQK